MTQRTETEHRRAERKARLMSSLLDRSLTRRDRVGKAVLGRLVPAEPPDPELDHPGTVDQPS